MAKFKYYGSKPLPHIEMGALFVADGPTEVRDPAAINWLMGHPEYVAVLDVPEETVEETDEPEAPKKARKAKK